MSLNSILSLIVLVALALPASATVTMDWVNVGNPGNSADPLTGYGAVGHEYKIGKYEVTNNQYAAFLNAVAPSDPHGLYSSSMANISWGGIAQSGASGSFTYAVKEGMGNKPVTLVSWFDAARMANWMHNGQGDGNTETGVYTLNSATSGMITRNAGAAVWIPTEDEWFKAAYYNGSTGMYSLYATGADTISMEQANYGGSNGVNTVTNVGGYEFPSVYGTYDQTGNVWEWNDAVIDSSRVSRGGSWSSGIVLLPSTRRIDNDPSRKFEGGFRVASAVPEPTSMLLSMVASGMMLIRRKR